MQIIFTIIVVLAAGLVVNFLRITMSRKCFVCGDKAVHLLSKKDGTSVSVCHPCLEVALAKENDKNEKLKG